MRRQLFDTNCLAIRTYFQQIIQVILPCLISAACLYTVNGFGISLAMWPTFMIFAVSSYLLSYPLKRLLQVSDLGFDLLIHLSMRMVVLALVVTAVLLLESSVDTFPADWASLFMLLIFGFGYLVTFFSIKVCLRRPFRRHNQTMAIVGVTPQSIEMANQIQQHPYLAVEIVGFFESRMAKRLPEFKNFDRIASMEQISQYVQQHPLDHVMISLPTHATARIHQVMQQLLDSTSTIHHLQDFAGFKPIREHITLFGSMSVYTVVDTPQELWGYVCKRGLDILLSLLALILLSPLFLLVAAWIKLDSKGAVLFKQKRWGMGGEPFEIYKFRSMTQEASKVGQTDQVQQTTQNDMRVTRAGQFLRKTSIDELPQLLNVLKGDMSIVGPRPHVEPQNQSYREQITGYMLRHKIRPGLTGWAQIHGFRGETARLEQMSKRVEYDLEYIRIWSPLLDLYIMIKTVGVVIKGTNAY